MKKVTIILPTYAPDREVAQHLDRCMESLYTFTPDDLYELVIIENGSFVASGYRSDLYIHSEMALGYAKAVNIGLRLVKTEYVCILNNDIILSDRWLEGLIRDFDSVARCGTMAPQEAGAAPGITFDDHWWSCVLTKTGIVGYLDDELLNFRFHDQSKSIELRQRGYQICRTGKVIVRHANSATYSKMNVDEGPEREEMMRRHGAVEFSEWLRSY